MKEQIFSIISEIQNNLPFPNNASLDEIQLTKNNDNDRTFAENSQTLKEKTSEIHDDKIKIDKTDPVKNQENDLLLKLNKLLTGEIFPDNFQKYSENEQREWLYKSIKLEHPDWSENVLALLVGTLFNGDCGRSPDDKPDWLDIEKFKRGQKFARDNVFGLSYSQLLSLIILFSFDHGLKTLILTEKSSTPYTAFKRYLSTSIRLRNWYTEDPWTKGTAAYNDIQAVRKMHAVVRKRLEKTKNEDIDAATKIKNPLCPTKDIIFEDLQSTCPAVTIGQCPYFLFKNPETVPYRPKGISQAEMAATQFAFVGLMILYPKSFGVHNASEEDLEAFCHTWWGLGYLLGMDDEYNLCRGSLSEVKQRCKDFVEIWAKPNLREYSSECEHMARCVVESLKYYFPTACYECCILYLMELLNLQTPTFNSTVTYKCWIMHQLTKSFFFYTSRIPGIMTIMNKRINYLTDKAVNFSPEKHEELKRKSKETLEKNTVVS